MISRRDVLTYLAAAAAASRLAPLELFAQDRPRQLYGKDKLIIRSLRPPDFETPVSLLNSFITPNNAFYVRSHLPIPQVDAATFVLKVGGEVNSPFSLSVDEIKKLPAVTTTVTLECAGNGRAFFQPPVAGIQWEKGAVSTARFTGARLSDVLKKAGVKTGGINVEMHAADRPLGTMPAFVRQVPMAKAMHPDTIIAYDMNGRADSARARRAAARDHPGLGRRVFGEVAQCAERARERFRQFLGRHRLSLSDQARRARRRG